MEAFTSWMREGDGSDFSRWHDPRLFCCTCSSFLLQQFPIEFPRSGSWCSIVRVVCLSTSQGVRSASHDDRIGCLGISAELCWAGVYVEERTREVLYLSLDGRASISPGTQATDTIGGCLRWRAEADVLYMVDCDGQPLEWPSVGGLLRREAQRAGELPGFYVGPHAPERRSNPENSGFVTSTDVYFARDPLGFVFTGCVYTLRLPRRSTWTFGAYGDRQHRVVLGADGVVTDVEEGHRVGTWSFAAAPLAPESEVWATGDTVTLHIEGLYGEVSE